MAKIKILCQLQMDEHDFIFYSDQKMNRRSRAINNTEKSTPSDAAFK